MHIYIGCFLGDATHFEIISSSLNTTAFFDGDYNTCQEVTTLTGNDRCFRVEYTQPWTSTTVELIFQYAEIYDCEIMININLYTDLDTSNPFNQLHGRFRECLRIPTYSETTAQGCMFECTCPSGLCDQVYLRIESSLKDIHLCEFHACA